MEDCDVIQMDFRETKPVCIKIKDEIRKQILMNALESGEILPSVGMLASRKAVNPNAVLRAYQELCDEGYITKKDEYYIVLSHTSVEKVYLQDLFEKLDEIVIRLLNNNCSKEELEKRIGNIVERSRANDSSEQCH